jgi:autotransporter-associated beta strand protein
MTDCGFVKTGAGTFSVASMTNKVSGVITVSEGTMRVDGCLVTPSSVEVVSGAYLGGTGTVANVSLETGAGFCAPAGQKTPLVVEGDLVLPDTGAVDVLNLGGADEKDLPAVNLVRATGTLSGTENLSGWIVKIDGVESKNWKLEVRNGIFRAKYNNGFAVVVR